MAIEPRFEVYPRWLRGDYGWRFRAANGQITAIGGEGFTRREDARRALRSFMDDLESAEITPGDREVWPPIIDVDE